MNYAKTIALLSATVLVSACGGGGGGGASTGPTPGATVVSLGLNPTGMTASYVPGSDTIEITNGSTTFTYARTPFVEDAGNTNRVYSREGEDNGIGGNWFDYAIYGETPGGNGTAMFVAATQDNYDAAAVFLERIGSTTLPGAGPVTFAGGYTAFLLEEVPEGPIANFTIHGNVQLDADFNLGLISGLITNREDQGATYENVTLSLANISGAGAFSGTASGGERIGVTSSTSNGAYTGLLVGPDGSEAIGTVFFERTDDGAPTDEVGIFTAAETP